MRGVGQRPGRGVGARRAARVIAGWFCLAVVVTAVQAGGVSSAIAQHTSVAQHRPSPTTVASDAVLAWGDNYYGQLGDGTTNNYRTVPIPVGLPKGTEVTAAAGGDAHSLAVTSAGTVLAWGRNAVGQLGDGTAINRSTPVDVRLPPGITVTAVAAGFNHSLAVTSAGTVFAWGDNSTGQLGDGTRTNRSTPVAVSFPPGTVITAVAAGGLHSLALTSAGTVFAWGDNSSAQLGDGSTTNRSTPVVVGLPVGTIVTAIAGGGSHSLAVTSAGNARAWGNNFVGQLGDGSNINRDASVHVRLPPGTTVTAVAGGLTHSLALTSVGTVLSWGSNNWGQLGDGTARDRNTPGSVSLPPGVTITVVAAGDLFGLAITSVGTVLAWGGNIVGQLGDGTTTVRRTPVAASLPTATTITAIATGSGHSLALVAPRPASTTTLRVSPRNPTADQDVTLTATVTCTTDTPTGSVTFRSNTTDLATVPLGSANTATHTTGLPPGTHTLTAHYTSTNTCPSGQSESTTITITAPDNPNTPDDPDLPITGPNLPTILGTATLLILAGATFLYLTRRTARRDP
ncbi:Ig-like domain repeat protein [Salinispora arenicola]|uniref:Ig-like domain repeat protein n=1 Tax=Salinispora arenicola TaxID=168697 RepID=UPI001692AAB1|nr:Ig-like domain repeat protein [Salinispora arenicola]NIL56672.1 cell wall anchor protein [Salinispora arenicola]NIL63484.1 cell wall anchor protein [Salinispora arenicola]